jgi:hypothetical protein
MAKFSVSIRPYKCSARPNAKWVLNVWHPTGKRERSYFETKETAQAAEQVKTVEVQNLGWRALQIDDRLRLEALDAKEKLAPYGVSLTAVVAEYHLAKFQNAPALALELGHQSNALIFSNYRRRVTELEAAEYFNLVPQ